MKLYPSIRKILKEDVYFYTLLLLLVSVLSFGLGRLSQLGHVTTQQGSVVLSKQSTAVSTSTQVQTEATLVGSKNGTRFHALHCAGASQIKEENKLYFTSVLDAHAKGYTQAANCDL